MGFVFAVPFLLFLPLAGWLSGRSIEFGIVPIGAGLMAASLASLGLLPEGDLLGAALSVAALGFGAGLFIVPLESFLQFRSPEARLGSIQATGSFLSWLGILLASGVLYGISALGRGPEEGFLMLSGLLFGLTILSLWVLPDFFGKFIIMLITRAVYKLRVNGLENVPVEGGALLVSNHASLMDALLVAAGLQRRPRMLMSREFYENAHWLTRRIADLAKVILIHGSDNPKQLICSLQVAREALDDGYLVCVFAEGALTRTGMMRPFKPGFERIVKGTDYPIIPIYIGGAWGSLSSYRHGMPNDCYDSFGPILHNF